ncbi:hypothetical protein [Trinickia sp.]|uniref:hypothetical protein n=1 Tax=Trinickia sp. TaxID=2571163 RepID=UPI003F7ED2DC
MSAQRFESLDEALPAIIAAARLGVMKDGRRTVQAGDIYSAAQRVGYTERITIRALGKAMKDAAAVRVTNGPRGAKYALPERLVPKKEGA